MWRGVKVLVTGGNGFLGSHLVHLLVAAGAQVICLIKEKQAFSILDASVTYVSGVVEDLSMVRAIMKDCDSVFHLAARPVVSEAQVDPFPMLETNVRGTYNVLEAARLHGKLRSVVVVSSDKVYGDAKQLPYTEDTPLNGLGPYDASKVCTDILARSYARSFGLPVAVVRAGNLYGPGDSQWSRVVPGTIKSLLGGERPVIRGDGQSLRDYFYVEDAAAALLTLGAALDDPKVQGEAFNFGTGVPTSTFNVVRDLIERSGSNLEQITKFEACGEIKNQYLDCSKAKALLGWVPRTALSDGLDRTWSWYKANLS